MIKPPFDKYFKFDIIIFEMIIFQFLFYCQWKRGSQMKPEESTEISLRLFQILARTFRVISEQILLSIRPFGLNLTEFAVLELIYKNGPQSLGAIGSHLLMVSGGVTYVVDKLEQSGYLTRRHSPKDRRVIYACLTDRGTAFMERIYPEFARTLNEMLEGMSREEKEQLMDLLKKLEESAQKK
jgi:MarR family 2-MHQ and catechol resistance regulon transcriptional repressor